MRELRVETPDGVFELIVRGDPESCPTVEEANRSFLALCEVLRVVATELEHNVAAGIPPRFPETVQ